MTTYLALIAAAENAIVAIGPDTIGFLELPGIGTVSPPQVGWSGSGYRIVAIEPADIPAGRRRVSLGIDGVEFVDGEPTWILEDEPPTRRMVAKSMVTQRVIDAGLIDQAMALLQMDWAKFARWVAPDQPAVYFDDADTVLMVETLGLDPGVIMAPE